MRVDIEARDLRVGDRIDARSRITRIMARNGKIIAQVKVQGSRAPGVARWNADQPVRVFSRRGA